MKATLLLRKDHEKVRELFEKIRGAKSAAHNGNRALFEGIRREITAHSHIETELFYPALLETTSKRAEELVAAARDDHEKIDKLLAELSTAGTSDKGFESKLNR